MNRPTITIHDLATNKIIERQMNDEEFSQYQADMAAQNTLEAQIQAKETARQAVLDKLGLTAEEMAALLP